MYDIILLPHTNSFGGNSGLYALQTQPLLTTDAFLLMARRLSDGGIIAVTCWQDHPPRHVLRVLSILVETLAQGRVAQPERHVAAIRSWGTVTFLMSKSPFQPLERRKLEEFCQRHQFDPILMPGTKRSIQPQYHLSKDNLMNQGFDAILGSRHGEETLDYPFKIDAPTADRPYFSQFIKWSAIPDLLKLYGSRNIPFIELGSIILAMTLAVLTTGALCLIIAPLFFLTGPRTGLLRVLLYFGGIGLGYMFVEIAFIQRFMPYLENPVYSTATVITTMLVCSGVGSHVSQRVSTKSRAFSRVIAAIVGILLLYLWGLDWFLDITNGLPFSLRFCLVMLLTGLPAVFMGMPFPRGLSSVADNSSERVPWAWGVNGCLSVISAVLAMLISVEFGVTVVLLLAAMAYCLPALACRSL